MKKVSLWSILMLVVLTLPLLAACGGDDSNNDGTKPDNPSETKFSPVGVWENGDYFVSFNNENFCCAYFEADYIDCGSYSIGDNIITCNNIYYGKQTRYHITKITEVALEVKIEYNSMEGKTLTKTMTFTKCTNKTAPVKDHTLVGKSYSSLVWLGENNTSIWSFETYYTGTHSMKSGAASKYPLGVYYVFFDGKIYYQTFKTTQQMPTIGGWNPSTTVSISEVTFSSNGSISNISKIK